MNLITNLHTEIDIVHCDHPWTEYDNGKIDGLRFGMTEIKSLATKLQTKIDRLQSKIDQSYPNTALTLLITRRNTLIEIIEDLVGKPTD